MNIKHGLFTKLGAAVATLALVPPLLTQLIADVENTQAHWSGTEKTAVISGAFIIAIGAVTKAVQAGIAIWKGAKDV